MYCAMRPTQDVIWTLAKSASNTAAAGPIVQDRQASVSKRPDSLGLTNEAQQEHDRAVATLDKLPMAKWVFAAKVPA